MDNSLRRLALIIFISPLCFGQSPWGSILDPSRAINWTSVGFTIPSYSVNCLTQPSLATGSGNAAANTTSIQNALASCDSTHNVVLIPSGTWYVTAATYGTQGHQVLRGTGPTLTTLIPTTGTGGGGGLNSGILMKDAVGDYNGSGDVLPPSGTRQCLWTGGLTQGSTSITLSSCGGTPPINQTIILDQANDTSDTSGIYICDTNIANCGYEGSSGGNNDGRSISGVTHSEQQITYVTGVTSLGGGSYTVTISPGVYFTNIRSGKSPGAWWPGFVQNDGIENMTIDGSNVNSTVNMYNCYQCWEKNVRSINAGRNHVMPYQSSFDVIRDSYFYQSQSHYSESYVIEFEESSGVLVENNIMQQVTNPIMSGQTSGSVISHNYSVGNIYSGAANWMSASYSVHNAGNVMNLWEGNNLNGIWADDAWGSSDQETYFRNMLIGWQTTLVNATFPVLMRANNRAFNMVGNVLGQPSYHTQYQTYATSTSGGTGASAENTSIFTLGWGGTGPVCSSGAVTACDPLTFSSLMRWGNYDVVSAAVRYNTGEGCPAGFTYANANCTNFATPSMTLPASLYYASTPSWWPSGKSFPPVGPDVSTGNVGYCTSGTYAKSQATSAGQCVSGGLTTAWASHVISTPAQDCYLNIMGGVPDGTGSMLSFNANTCYSSSPVVTTPGTPVLLIVSP